MKNLKRGGKTWQIVLVFLLAIGVFLTPTNLAFASPITRTTVIEFTNRERIKAGLPILWSNYKLNLAAQRKAEDMLVKGYWEHYHNGKSPWDWMHEAGYDFRAAGENLAIDFFQVEPMIAAWMASPTHRQNILNPNFKEIGVGVAKGWFKDHNTIVVVQMFGDPKGKVVRNSQVAGITGEEPENLEDKQSPVSLNEEKQLSKTTEQKAGFWTSLVDKIKNLFVWLYIRFFALFSWL